MDSKWSEKSLVNLPESPKAPMEFLSRSWSASALQVCKALTSSSPSLLPKASIANSCANITTTTTTTHSNNTNSTSSSVITIPENISAEEEDSAKLAGNTFSFASSATSQLVLERIMSQSVSTLHNFLIFLALFLHLEKNVFIF